MPITKQDWFEIGLQLLVSTGSTGLTIDAMCRALKVTKGSFYHHFKNLQDFKEQLLGYWQEVDTRQVVEAASSLGPENLGVDGLVQVLGSRSAETANPEIAIRAWARQDDTVRSFLQQVDVARIEMTQAMLGDVIVDAERAHRLARLLYAMLVGCYSILPPVEKDEVHQLYQEFKKLIELDKH